MILIITQQTLQDTKNRSKTTENKNDTRTIKNFHYKKD